MVAVAIVGAIWTLGMAGMSPPPSLPARRALARAFAHTLIPIAAGYLVAHYFSLLAYNGQDLWRLVNDPLGKGSDLFGGADAGIDYGVVSATGIWYVQIGALVAGHVGGARARARSRARGLRLGPCRDALAGRHADPDGRLHPARPVAALGGAQRMTRRPRRPLDRPVALPRAGRGDGRRDRVGQVQGPPQRRSRTRRLKFAPRGKVARAMPGRLEDLRAVERRARRGEPRLRRLVRAPGLDAYAVYRAAEDRADAAEADLAFATANDLIFA